MRRLLDTELRRLLSRRIVRVTALLIAAGILVAGVITTVKSKPPVSTDTAARAARLEACLQGDFSAMPFAIDQESFDRQLPPGSEQRRQFCEANVEAWARSGTFNLTELSGILKATAAMMVVVALLFGASFIGAEWRSGSLATTLTWEPRRLLLAGTKVLAAVMVTVAFVASAQAVISLVLWLAATLRGSVEGAGIDLARTIIGEQARIMLLIAFGTMFGFAMGMLGKNTTAALGVAFGYIIVFEQILIGVVAWLRPWLILPNSAIFVSGGSLEGFLQRSVLEAGLTLAFYAVGLLAVSIVAFQRRDVLA